MTFGKSSVYLQKLQRNFTKNAELLQMVSPGYYNCQAAASIDCKLQHFFCGTDAELKMNYLGEPDIA